MQGHAVKAYVAENPYWMNVGTPETFDQVAFDETHHPHSKKHSPRTRRTGWFAPCWPATVRTGNGTALNPAAAASLADHGIHATGNTSEAAAFVAIGTHLFRKNVPVPEIYYTRHVQRPGICGRSRRRIFRRKSKISKDEHTTLSMYHQVIEAAVKMWTDGKTGFDPAWTCQTPTYDRQLIPWKECRYFVDAFLKVFLGMDMAYENLAGREFSALADLALENALPGPHAPGFPVPQHHDPSK
ncbi:MAG: hypothetical protein R2860_06535 [Desulfobacterales bacterium]